MDSTTWTDSTTRLFPSNDAFMRETPKLNTALAKAQARIVALVRDVKNPMHEKKYVSSDSIISECKEALNAESLALLPISFEKKPEDPLATIDANTTLLMRGGWMRRYMKLTHSSGEWTLIGPIDWPINPSSKLTPLNVACSICDTISLAYTYRGVLGAPRLTPEEIKAMERQEEKDLMEANAAKATAQKAASPPAKEPAKPAAAAPAPAAAPAAPTSTPAAAAAPAPAAAAPAEKEAKSTRVEIPAQPHIATLPADMKAADAQLEAAMNASADKQTAQAAPAPAPAPAATPAPAPKKKPVSEMTPDERRKEAIYRLQVERTKIMATTKEPAAVIAAVNALAGSEVIGEKAFIGSAFTPEVVDRILLSVFPK